jgi:hypothetical protein
MYGEIVDELKNTGMDENDARLETNMLLILILRPK